ncbi:UDPGP type 1 family protein [bacterium]|nr:UDPGP type 1 family protein [bacterium]RQV94301.1 MAG: UDPGP type 1 family protein [bacterium]
MEIERVIRGQKPEDQSIIQKVFQEDQGHVFRWWEELSDSAKRKMLAQLRSIDFGLIHVLKNRCMDQLQSAKFQENMDPPDVISVPMSPEERKSAIQAKRMGKEVIRSGKLGILTVAGGQGTRLGYDKPKGCFPIGPVTGNSLFQMHAEKILAASRFYKVSIPWYIMTSETNDERTKEFFDRNGFFGLHKEDIIFVKQDMLPALDAQGKFILDAKDHIFTSPNGHGGILSAVADNHIIENMKRQNIEIISYFQVDNVLIKIVDPVFVGYHVQAQADMSSKMVKKRNSSEKIGHFVRINGKLHVIEYSDMPESAKLMRNPDGRLKYEAGSIAIHLFEFHFMEKFMGEALFLPYHVAHKKIPYLNDNGNWIKPEKPNGYKFEKFIFDAIQYANHSVVMEVARKEEFSPVKNKIGENSPETARRDLSNFFGCWLESAGISVPRNAQGDVKGQIEISPLYAFDKDQFLKKVDRDLCFQESLYLGPQ